jgi:hypothetical protein
MQPMFTRSQTIEELVRIAAKHAAVLSDRFMREIRVLARIQHPNMVSFFEMAALRMVSVGAADAYQGRRRPSLF